VVGWVGVARMVGRPGVDRVPLTPRHSLGTPFMDATLGVDLFADAFEFRNGRPGLRVRPRVEVRRVGSRLASAFA